MSRNKPYLIIESTTDRWLSQNWIPVGLIYDEILGESVNLVQILFSLNLEVLNKFQKNLQIYRSLCCVFAKYQDQNQSHSTDTKKKEKLIEIVFLLFGQYSRKCLSFSYLVNMIEFDLEILQRHTTCLPLHM